MRFPLVARRWRNPKILFALMGFELCIDIALLTFFGIADPDTYREKLWQNGADQGFNSSPSDRLYELANYRPYTTPLVWSQFITSFNVVIAILAVFLLLVKIVMFIMRGLLPVLSVIVHSVLVALFAVSIHGQIAPDMSDEEHPSSGPPWYLSKGCSYATDKNRGYCMQARGAFGVTCVALALFATYVLLSLHSSIPTRAERAARASDIEMKKISEYSPEEEEESREERWERNRQLFLNLPKSPVTPAGFARNPMTPRTVAFTQLSGEEVAQRSLVPMPSMAGPSGGLPFRAYDKEGMPDAR